MRKLLRVHMNKAGGCVTVQDLPPDCAGLGGRALGLALTAAWAEGDDPDSGRQALVFAPGLLAGTPAPASSRTSVVGARRSGDGTVRFTWASAGGVAGGLLAALGYAAVLFDGEAEPGQWRDLVLTEQGAALHPSVAAGLGNFAAVAALTRRYGDGGVISIGPAGEKLLHAAAIAFMDKAGRPVRQAGRGGLGALMGAGGLKSIVLLPGTPNLRRPVRDAVAFAGAVRRFTRALARSEAFSATSAGKTGRVFHSPETTEKDVGIDRVNTPYACMSGCVSRSCGLGGKRGQKPVGCATREALERAGFSDPDVLSAYTRLCDDMGLDTVTVGAAVALAVRDGRLAPGDAGALAPAVTGIGRGSLLERYLDARDDAKKNATQGDRGVESGLDRAAAWTALADISSWATEEAGGKEPDVLLRRMSVAARTEKGETGIPGQSRAGAGGVPPARFPTDSDAAACADGQGGSPDAEGAGGAMRAALDQEWIAAVADSLGLCLFAARGIVTDGEIRRAVLDMFAAL